MHSRSILVLAIVWLSSLVASNLGTGAGPKKPRPFKHNDHVLFGWASSAVPEVFRDCRGCHRFDADHPVSAPQDHCASCHFGTGALTIKFEGDSKERLNDFKSRTRSAFQHHTHGMLECRECHALEEGLPIPGSLPLTTGPGECARCHEASQARQAASKLRWFLPASQSDEMAEAVGLPGGKFTVPTDFDDYAKTLDQVFSAKGAGINVLLDAGGDFTHGDHSNIDCKDCHQGIEKATAAGVGAAKIVANGCGSCHLRSKDKPARLAGGKKQLRDSFSLGAFAHADHFRKDQSAGICTEDGYKLIADGSCCACHTYGPKRLGYAGRDFPFDGVNSRHRYQDCQKCHAIEGWDTGETVDDPAKPPLHGSTSADGVSGWQGEQQKCTACHAFGEPDMAGNRPKAQVRRWTGKTFVFSGQTHPYITDVSLGEAGVQKDCKDCHRAVVPSLPSRLIKKTFRHETHLPGGDNLSAGDCATCHKSASNSSSSDALAIDFRTYDPAHCATCHVGGSIQEDIVAKSEPVVRVVVAFPHGPHVAKVDCMKCHDRGAENMATSASALDCKQCHDHKLGEDGVLTEYLFGEQKTCAKCHTETGTELVKVPAIRGSGATTSDSRYGIEQTVFAGFRDRQFHPSRSDCATCHLANVSKVLVDGKKVDRLQPIKTKRVDFVFAERLGLFHTGKNDKKLLIKAFKGKEVGCMSCHWKDFGSLKINAILPEDPEQRKRLGNEFGDFPGLKSKG